LSSEKYADLVFKVAPVTAEAAVAADLAGVSPAAHRVGTYAKYLGDFAHAQPSLCQGCRIWRARHRGFLV
jgi:hypothetical protein